MHSADVLLVLYNEVHAPWSDSTFGDTNFRGPEGPLEHLLEEAKEAFDKPTDIEERADCLALILDANRRDLAQRVGANPLEAFALLVDAYRAKLIKNIGREWGKASPDSKVNHDRSKDEHQHYRASRDDKFHQNAEAAKGRHHE